MKYLSLVLTLLLVIDQGYAQSKAISNRPPWIVGVPPSWSVGDLPRIDLQGNILQVRFTQDLDPEKAQKKAEEEIAAYLLSRSGVVVSSQEILKSIHEGSSSYSQGRLREQSTTSKRYNRTIELNGKVYGRYSLVDKYTQYKGGRYYFAGLFLVAEQDMTLASIPPITYGIDRGAWRSLIIPGWAQLYTGRTGAGIGYMAVQAGLIASTIYLHNRADYSLQRMNEARGIKTKQTYKKDYDQMITYRNISAGVCMAWYALNVLDAFTSKRGKLYYTVAYGQTSFSVAPIPTIDPVEGHMGLGLACSINF